MTDEMTPVTDETAPPTTLVELENGLALLFGDHVPDGVELIPFSFVDEATRTAMSTALTSGLGVGNVAAQGVNGLMQAQGLVRLAPQTLAALHSSSPVVSGGWNLGTLAHAGKFSASVRWLPATAATTTSVVASMGTALTMMAIQFQLNKIAGLAQHNIELTSTVLAVVRQGDWSEITGYHRTLMRELKHARELGAVTEAIYREISGYQGPLATQWDRSQKAVESHVTALAGKIGHKDRQQHLVDHGQAIVADVQSLLLAQTSWFVYEALRAGHLLASARENPQDEKLLKTLVANAQTLHETTLDQSEQLLDQLAREFALISELPGKRTFVIGGAARAAKDVKHMVRQLQAALAAIRGEDAPLDPPALDEPWIRIFKGEIPDELIRILPHRLEPSERVLALADISCDRWDRLDRVELAFAQPAGWGVITDRRILIAKQDAFKRTGTIEFEIRNDDIRYVRRPDRPGKAPTVDVVARDFSLTIKFFDWAKAGQPHAEANRFGELVASLMHLPPVEVPIVNIPEPARALLPSGA